MSDPLGLRELLADDEGCPCGTGSLYFGEGVGARTRHANWHLQWDRGVPVPSRVLWFKSLAIVTSESARADQDVAYRLGRLFQREQRYDFPMVPESRFWRTGDMVQAMIAVHRHRAIGILVTRPVMGYGVWDGSPESVQINVSTTEPLPEISGVWVARGYRRHGVARALVSALVEYADTSPAELVWGVPFSDDGQALATATSGFPMRIC
jgi:GNAT superfamily N-acetyltransferase